MKKITTEQSLLNRILFIAGEKEGIPESLVNDERKRFMVLGTPQDVIDETDTKVGKKSQFEIACWIAEYSYQKANKKTVGEPPSMVYEQVSKDFSNFLSN